MKKYTAIALASAIAIAAGSFAAVNLPQASSEAQEGSVSAGESAGISYEEAIADLYARSTSISDQEILDIARNMKPDCTAVSDELGEAQANRIIETLSAYEDQKAAYLLDNSAETAEDGLAAEWERQREYTAMGISGDQKLTKLIPGYTVTSCKEEDGRILIDVDEWMTEGYTEGDDDVENVSAYRYYYTAVLEESAKGNWEVVSVINTDRNYAWLEDAEVQQEQFEDMAEQSGAEDSAADLQGSAVSENGMKTSTLKTYGDGRYTYDHTCCRGADKLILYDKEAVSHAGKIESLKKYNGTNQPQASITGMDFKTLLLLVRYPSPELPAGSGVTDYDVVELTLANPHRWEKCKITDTEFTVTQKLPHKRTVRNVYQLADGALNPLAFSQSSKDTIVFTVDSMSIHPVVIEYAEKEPEASVSPSASGSSAASAAAASSVSKPKGTVIKKIKSGHRKIKVTWKKQTKNVSGYQIQYGTKKNFKKAKTVKVKGAKKTSKVIKKLKSGKRYYVRIRSYRIVKRKKYVSAWSKRKTVKVR